MSLITELPNIFPDFITSRNFLLFIINKEYLDLISRCKENNIIDDLFEEEAKFNFYLFLFKSVKDDSVDLFNIVKENNNVLKGTLTKLARERVVSIVEDLEEQLTYTHMTELINSILSGFHEREEVGDTEKGGSVCKYSVMGVFMRKFALAFNSLSIEKVLSFNSAFKKVVAHYGIIEAPVENKSAYNRKIKEKLLSLKCARLSKDQVLSSLENIYKNVDNLLFEPNANKDSINDIRSTLGDYKQMYPNISDTSFLDHMLSIKNKNLETFEKDIQNNFPARFLCQDEELSETMKNAQTLNKDSKNTSRALNLFSFHQKMSEISLNSAATLLSMGFKDEALLNYKNALFNAKLSKNTELLDDVKNVGNSLMAINDNPNPTVFSKNTDTLSDKAALGNIRISMLQHMHNSQSSLSELLQIYFTSVAPQRRDITPICLIYLSIVFRSFGFESMANTYMLIAASLESIRRTKNHEQVLIEMFVHLIENFTALGHFDKAINLFKSLKSLGGGILCENIQIESSMIQCYFNHSILKLDFFKANICIEKLKHFFLAEYGLRRVQLLFLEDNNVAADRFGNHIISFAIKKRDLLVYNHVSISTGRPTVSSTITNHITSGIVENSLEASVTKEFPTLDDIGSQSWGSRDWALYECRCRWLMCCQLINRRQLKTALSHLNSLKELAHKFSFYQFIRLSQILQLAFDSCENMLEGLPIVSPLSLKSNSKKAESILSSRFGLSYKSQMIFLNILLKLYINQPHVSKNADFESQLVELGNYCKKSDDFLGQAHCWQMLYNYSNCCGDNVTSTKAKFELELLLENRCVNKHNIDFLSNVL